MVQPLFDFDLKRVSRRHYITGKAAINFPHPECSTGGWHFLSYFDREAGVVKLSLAGIHYPDTDAFFGDMGISDVTEQLRKRGWPVAQASDSANAACSPTDTYVRLVLSLLIRQRVHRASRWSVLHNVGRKQALRRLSHYPMTFFTEISDFADPLAERPIEHAVTSR